LPENELIPDPLQCEGPREIGRPLTLAAERHLERAILGEQMNLVQEGIEDSDPVIGELDYIRNRTESAGPTSDHQVRINNDFRPVGPRQLIW
jgi:hypothetical protein